MVTGLGFQDKGFRGWVSGLGPGFPGLEFEVRIRVSDSVRVNSRSTNLSHLKI